MYVCSLLLLFGGVGWLEDQEGLDEKEEGGGVEELGDVSSGVMWDRGVMWRLTG